MDRICSYCQSVLNFDKPNDLACTCSPKNYTLIINEQNTVPFLHQDTYENELFSYGAGMVSNDDETALSDLEPDNLRIGDFTESWLNESGGEVINNLTEDFVAAHNVEEPSVVNRLALVGMEIIPSENEQSELQESNGDASTCDNSEYLKSPESGHPPILQRMNAMGPREFSELLRSSESDTVESSQHTSQRAMEPSRDIVHPEAPTNTGGTTVSHFVVPSAPSDNVTIEMNPLRMEAISKQLPSQGSRVAKPSDSRRESSRLTTPRVIKQSRNCELARPRCTVPCPTECSSIGTSTRLDENNYLLSSHRFNDVKSPPNPPYLNSRSINDTDDETSGEQTPAPRRVIDENKSDSRHSHFVSYRSW